MKFPVTIRVPAAPGLELAAEIEIPDVVQSVVPPREVLSEKEAAEWLGVSEDCLYRAHRDGELARVGFGRRALYRIADLRAWIERSTVGPRVLPMRRAK